MHQLGERTEGQILHHAPLHRHARLLAQARRRSLTHIIIQPNSLSLSLSPRPLARASS
ncbi:unnamed protein product [Linum tenue]|uniref:Uncharacterized protein n=1 Tax=Linum tenue TaxID=586396 RepID=A0AAV0RFC9_9ROSI|nr:unnamed protein product [Linum tenue]